MNDPQQNLDDQLNKIVLVNRIIVGALIAGVTTFIGLVLLIRASGNKPAGQFVLTPVGVGFAVVALAGAAVVPKLAMRRWHRQIAAGVWPALLAQGSDSLPAANTKDVTPEEEIFRWWNMYPVALIVRCALIEGAAFFQCISYLIEGNVIALIAAVVLVAILVYQWPGRARIGRWVEAQQEAVEQIRRGEVP
jgi:hypothetical protein